MREKRNEYMKKLEINIVNSDTPKKIIDNLKCIGKLRNEIPIIINSDTGKIPKSTEESLNNLNKDFTNVYISQRKEEYNKDFMSEKIGESNRFLSDMKIGTEEWNHIVNNYNITQSEVMDIIKEYNNTSDGPDQISIKILKKIKTWSGFVIFKLVIQSLKEGKLPSQLKNSDIIPILKNPSENRHVFKNFRPISVTSIIARICEKVIFTRIQMKVDKSIPEFQYGSRKGTGTVDALSHLWSEIITNTSIYDETNVVFLDIQKAFDRLNWHLIIWKLKNLCGISDPIIQWIYDFLSDRKQRIKCWGTYSNWRKVKGGGPQGAVLLPILFILYISDVPLDTGRNIQNTRGIKYVDDISIYSTGQYNHQIEDLNRRLNDIYIWSNCWGVDFSVRKCKSITFHTSKSRPDYNRNLIMGNSTLENVKIYKYLGMWLKYNLSFDVHIQKKIQTCNMEMNQLLTSVKKVQSGKRNFSRIFWRSKLRPILEYGCEIWSQDHDMIEPVEKFQTKYVRYTHKYGSKSCVPAMLLDMSFVKMGLRICSIREKYQIKCKLSLVPTRIQRLYNNQIPRNYSKKIYRDNNLKNETGYPNVKNYKGKKKYISTVQFYQDGKSKKKNFLNNYSIISEKERIHWINRNFDSWYELRKPRCTVFNFEKLKLKNYYNDLINDFEIDYWMRIWERDLTKLFNYIKMKIKIRTFLLQEKLWNEIQVGKVLRTYRKEWYVDNLLNNVEDPKVYLIKRMRIGNSSLRGHHGEGLLTTCVNCEENEVETNEHYFLKCRRFEQQRKKLFDNLNGIMDGKVDIKDLLGFNHSKGKNQGLKIIKNVLTYIKETQRFN